MIRNAAPHCPPDALLRAASSGDLRGRPMVRSIRWSRPQGRACVANKQILRCAQDDRQAAALRIPAPLLCALLRDDDLVGRCVQAEGRRLRAGREDGGGCSGRRWHVGHILGGGGRRRPRIHTGQRYVTGKAAQTSFRSTARERPRAAACLGISSHPASSRFAPVTGLTRRRRRRRSAPRSSCLRFGCLRVIRPGNLRRSGSHGREHGVCPLAGTQPRFPLR